MNGLCVDTFQNMEFTHATRTRSNQAMPGDETWQPSGGPSSQLEPIVPPSLAFAFTEGPLIGTEMEAFEFGATIGRTGKSKLRIRDMPGWRTDTWTH